MIYIYSEIKILMGYIWDIDGIYHPEQVGWDIHGMSIVEDIMRI
jgi:hypothetical protein